MKVISPIFSSMSGKLGGAVGAKARGGIQYFRALVTPTNPSTALQTAIRMAVQSASSLWQNTLTEVQQQGWFDIAEGAQTGKSLFAKVNQARIYATNAGRTYDGAGDPATILPAYIADAPSGGLNTTVTIDGLPVVDDSDNSLQMGEYAAGPWNTGVDGTHDAVIYVYVSGPQTTSRMSRQRPYQLAAAFGITTTAAVTPPPIDLAALGLPTVTGRVFYVKTYVQDKDGRTSLPLEYRVEVTA